MQISRAPVHAPRLASTVAAAKTMSVSIINCAIGLNRQAAGPDIIRRVAAIKASATRLATNNAVSSSIELTANAFLVDRSALHRMTPESN